MSYQVVVCKASNVRKHSNADFLNLATCLGNQVVVGLDTPEGLLGIFAPTDGQFSDQFCRENNLYNASARVKLDLPPVEKPGFFDFNRRIRSQRFRGEKSDGIFLPLDCLQWTGADCSTLKEGDSFTEFGGYTIATKYYTPATLRALKGGTVKTRKENKCFPKNEDVKQFRFVADDIPEDSVIYLSEKLHGTSQRIGFVLSDVKLPIWKVYINRVFKMFPEQEYKLLIGSKNVILN